MIDKFQGIEGRRRLVEALRKQDIVLDSVEIANALADEGILVQFEPGGDDSKFIQQGGNDDDIYLILVGEVSVQINGREIATRVAGQTVGEMSCIEPTKPRSATVLPLKQTVLAKFSESTFTRLADNYAVLWRRIALEGAERLRERGKHVRPKNPKPRIFIGSSVEGLSITRAIQSCFSHDDFHLKPWTDGVFRATSTAIEDLLREVNQSDFAVLVLTADDMVICREMEMKAPRDNCIFELGLFLGALGRERTVIVMPRGADIKIPTDLLGVMPLDFKDDGPDYLAANLGPSCDSIRKLVKEMGLR